MHGPLAAPFLIVNWVSKSHARAKIVRGSEEVGKKRDYTLSCNRHVQIPPANFLSAASRAPSRDLRSSTRLVCLLDSARRLADSDSGTGNSFSVGGTPSWGTPIKNEGDGRQNFSLNTLKGTDLLIEFYR